MSQTTLADRAGLESRQVITSIEIGRREDIGIVELTKIAQVLGVTCTHSSTPLSRWSCTLTKIP
jgi:transcriptional regulator with XRE-family HTH domain